MKRVLLGGLGGAVLTIGLGAAPATAAEDRPECEWCTRYTWSGSLAEEVDSYVCPVLDDAPDAGPVEVTDEGDIYVAGEWIWDCPPYGGVGGRDGTARLGAVPSSGADRRAVALAECPAAAGWRA